MFNYLNVDQALADIAYFITTIKEQHKHKVTDRTPWYIYELNQRITVGGSYPGGMSAFFRQKYNHLTIGALASSPNTHQVLNFTIFDQ